MIETQTNARIRDAYRAAHAERGRMFATLFGLARHAAR